MSSPWRILVCTAAAAVIWSGCGTGPPGAGVTNVEPPVLGGPDKTAERTDLPVPTTPADSDAPLADSAALKPGAAPDGASPGTAPANTATAPGQGGSPTTPK